MYLNKQLQSKYNPETKTNEITGVCQHRDSEKSLKYVEDQTDIDFVIDELIECLYHLCTMINLIQIQFQTLDRTMNATCILAAIPHCGYKSLEYHKQWMKVLGEIEIEGVFDVKPFNTDGNGEWRKAKQELIGESNETIDVGICFVPKKIIPGLLCGPDQRHNIKSDWRKINLAKHGVKIVDNYITLAVIKKWGISLEIWSQVQHILVKNQFLAIFVGYKKDQMNVPLPLKFYNMCNQMIETENFSKLKTRFQNDEQKLNEFAIYSTIENAYITILFDRKIT
eukprot:531026_1